MSEEETPMTEYLLTMYQPDGPIPAPEVLAEIMAQLNVVRGEMEAAGAWVFSNGLCPPDTATVLRPENGGLLTTDGPFAEGKEHVGGVTIITAPDLDAALRWARRQAEITGLPIEVRPFAERGPAR
jgi:hypothetical protein